jgi:short-subunit dehydrogenase
MDAAQRPLALITGASAGIGAAFARAYAARGHDLALVARRADRLETLGAELKARYGVDTLVIAQDLAAFGAEGEVMKALAAQGRTVDVLVNNAGFSIAQDFAGVPWPRQRDFLMTLIVSACGLAHAVIPGMTARGKGSIINVASIAGFAPGVAGHSLYPAAKSFAIKFSEALDAELRVKGVKVTALCPGSTQSEFTKANGTADAGHGAPGFLVQTAETVVEAAIAGNAAGNILVIPGWHNRVAVFLMRRIPHGLMRKAIMSASQRFRLPPEPDAPTETS